MPMLLSFLKRGIFIFFGGIVVSIILTNLYLRQRVETLTEQKTYIPYGEKPILFGYNAPKK